MRVINPIGRKVETSASAHNVVVQGCMCHTKNNFNSARTTDDTCDRCGCNCYDNKGNVTDYKSANRKTARTAGRETPDIF